MMMIRKKMLAAAMVCATVWNAAGVPVPAAEAASEAVRYEFEDGVFSDCENNEGITWEQVDEDAEGNPCDMTGWSGDGFAYIDDKDSSVALTVNVEADGLYALNISYIQCFGKPSKIQYLYVNGESQGEISFPFNSKEGWTLLDAGYVNLKKGENEIKIVASVEGGGNIAFAYEGEEIDPEEDPTQMLQVTIYEPETMTFVATPDEGYKFVKWTQDGADLSEDAEIQVEVTQSTELVAIFDVE